MFIDLRTASSKKPNVFTDALMEYLAKELRNNNVKCRKKVSYIDVKIDRPVNNVYSNLIIDCFDGHVYLRGNNVSDKRVLTMRRFNLGNRESDALYCAKGACQQISRYLKKINTIEYNMPKEANRIDLRNKLRKVVTSSTKKSEVNKPLDLRGKVVMAKKQISKMKNNITTKLDLRNKTTNKLDLRGKIITARQRDFAIAIIDGKVYEGDTHGECVTQRLQEMGIEGIEFYDRIDLRENLGFNFYSQFVAAHCDGDKIYLDQMSLENISTDQAIQLLKDNYPNHDIYDYDTMDKLAKNFNKSINTNKECIKMTRLVKRAYDEDFDYDDDFLEIDWKEIEKNNKEIENYLASSGWVQNGVGIFVNEDYNELVDCIDMMSEQTMLYTTKSVNINSAEGYMVVSSNAFAINTLEGLKNLLNKLK